MIKANSFEDNMIFDYNSLMIDKNKKNNKLINKTSKNDKFKKDKEKDYNN